MRAPDPNILHRRNRELLILNHIAAALNGSLSLGEALHSTLAQVAELLDLHAGWIWLLREESGEPYLAAAQHLPPALASDPAGMEGWCYCLDTFAEHDQTGAANINVITCSRLRHLIDGTDGLRYHASIPLYAHERKIGVMNVASADWCKLAADDLRLLHTIGDLLGMAVERARLFDRSAAAGAIEERNRLARELHDTLAQGLTAVVLQLETADLLLEMGAPVAKVRERLAQALSLTRANLDEARRSVLDLRAAPLEGRTLAEALAALAQAAAPGQP
ncbi:MAG TPA: histidine kinase, partial [Herpetosiphonaceae bacterium]